MGVGWLVWSYVLRGTWDTGKFSTAPAILRENEAQMRQPTITPSKKLSELTKCLEPYAELWYEWTTSGATFLSKKEITVIENYLLTGSHVKSANILSISPTTSANIQNKSMRRLKWNYKKFQGWQTERLLEQHGIITYSSDLDRFLNSPYQYLPICYKIKTTLGFLDGETINEILTRYSENKINRWPFYPRHMNEFKEILREHECLHLLK